MIDLLEAERRRLSGAYAAKLAAKKRYVHAMNTWDPDVERFRTALSEADGALNEQRKRVAKLEGRGRVVGA